MKKDYRHGMRVLASVVMRVVVAAVVVIVPASAFAQCTWQSGATQISETCGDVAVGSLATPRDVNVVGNMNVINADGAFLTADVIRSTRGGGFGYFLGTAGGFVFQAVGSLRLKTGPTDGTTQEWLRITAEGVVGIGTVPASNSTNKLEVAGNANFTGTVAGGNIQAKYQDVAEWVPSADDLEPGTVVVVNADTVNEVKASSRSYDTAVAGVVSAQPGLILGEAGVSKEKIATTGRVKVRVDASVHPVKIGDLLVTSDKPGMAMVSVPLNLDGTKIHRPGTIIGKALEPLADGQGEILVLLAMQ
jgi:hypothetical protein